MKIESVCIGTPEKTHIALSSPTYANLVLQTVIGIALRVSGVLSHPAECYVQKTNIGVTASPGVMGVEVCLSGISRKNHPSRNIKLALKELFNIVSTTVQPTLKPGDRCQISCVIILDSDIEISPNLGLYGKILEIKEWIQCPK